jgi:membrane protease YdiL (CAAX protease family)
MIFTYGLLAASLIALWLPPLQLSERIVLLPWTVLFAAACISGMLTGLVTPPAVLVLLGFAALCYTGRMWKPGLVKVALLLAAGAMTLALSMHRFAGFANPSLVTEMKMGPNSPPFTHHLNFDTSAAGLILFAFFCVPARTREEWREVARQYPVILGTALVVLLFGLALGFVGFDPKFSGYTLLFIACNLLFTCITEEAFFRGFMQEKLSGAMRRWQAGPYIALGIAAVLFGIAHARGGPVLIALAALAGVGYGFAYMRSKRIEAAILTHLMLNAVHFIVFTYPRALP